MITTLSDLERADQSSVLRAFVDPWHEHPLGRDPAPVAAKAYLDGHKALPHARNGRRI